jgi:hypothetical protein
MQRWTLVSASAQTRTAKTLLLRLHTCPGKLPSYFQMLNWTIARRSAESLNLQQEEDVVVKEDPVVEGTLKEEAVVVE